MQQYRVIFIDKKGVFLLERGDIFIVQRAI